MIQVCLLTIMPLYEYAIVELPKKGKKDEEADPDVSDPADHAGPTQCPEAADRRIQRELRVQHLSNRPSY